MRWEGRSRRWGGTGVVLISVLQQRHNKRTCDVVGERWGREAGRKGGSPCPREGRGGSKAAKAVLITHEGLSLLASASRRSHASSSPCYAVPVVAVVVPEVARRAVKEGEEEEEESQAPTLRSPWSENPNLRPCDSNRTRSTADPPRRPGANCCVQRLGYGAIVSAWVGGVRGGLEKSGGRGGWALCWQR